MESWQSHSSEQEVFDTLLDFVQSCSNTLELIRTAEERTLAKISPSEDKKLAEIESERNTWRLIYALYQDRINTMLQDEEMEQDYDLELISEKEIMLRLYKNDKNIREVSVSLKLRFIMNKFLI